MTYLTVPKKYLVKYLVADKFVLWNASHLTKISASASRGRGLITRGWEPHEVVLSPISSSFDQEMCLKFDQFNFTFRLDWNTNAIPQLNDQEMCQSNFTQSRYQRACKGKCKLMSSSQEICVLFVLFCIANHITLNTMYLTALSPFVIIFTHRNILNQWYTKENIKKKEISRKHCL